MIKKLFYYSVENLNMNYINFRQSISISMIITICFNLVFFLPALFYDMSWATRYYPYIVIGIFSIPFGYLIRGIVISIKQWKMFHTNRNIGNMFINIVSFSVTILSILIVCIFSVLAALSVETIFQNTSTSKDHKKERII